MKKINLFLKRTHNLKLLILICLLLVLFFMYILSKPKNYEYKYTVNKIDILETYEKKDGIYYFNFTKENNIYEYAITSKYMGKKGLITDVSIENNCLKVKSKIDNYTICKDDNNNYVTSFYKDINKEKYKKTFNNIKIYDLKNYKYYIWNYKNLLSIDSNNTKEITLFKNDFYNLELSTKYDNYLVLPDYDSKHYFKNIYLVNSENDNVKKVELNKKIYFDSYFLGSYHNRLYLYDLDREKEYKINLKNGKVEKNPYEILNNGTWESTSKIKLNKKNQQFTNNNLFNYILEDSTLYYETPTSRIKMTNMNVDRIIDAIDNKVFFLVEDTIYYADLYTGITKVMQYSEWNFNNKNIYIFEK